jgi:hypothetical protein
MGRPLGYLGAHLGSDRPRPAEHFGRPVRQDEPPVAAQVTSASDVLPHPLQPGVVLALILEGDLRLQ